MGRGPGGTGYGECQGTQCCLCFGLNTGLQESQVPETNGKFWSKEDLPSVEEDRVREPLKKLDRDKFTGPGGMYPWVLRELADVIVRPLLVIFERSWWSGRVPEDWKKADVTSCIQEGRIWGTTVWSASLQLLGSWGKKTVVGAVSKHIKVKKVMGNS